MNIKLEEFCLEFKQIRVKMDECIENTKKNKTNRLEVFGTYVKSCINIAEKFADLGHYKLAYELIGTTNNDLQSYKSSQTITTEIIERIQNLLIQSESDLKKREQQKQTDTRSSDEKLLGVLDLAKELICLQSNLRAASEKITIERDSLETEIEQLNEEIKLLNSKLQELVRLNENDKDPVFDEDHQAVSFSM